MTEVDERPVYQFVAQMNRVLSDDEVDSLFDVLLDDVGIEVDPANGRTLFDFTRDREGLFEGVALLLQLAKLWGASVSALDDSDDSVAALVAAVRSAPEEERRVPQRFGDDVEVEDVNLDDEAAVVGGALLTIERAERMAQEALAESDRRGRRGDSQWWEVQFRVPAVLRERVEHRARDEGVPVSVLARRALRAYLDEPIPSAAAEPVGRPRGALWLPLGGVPDKGSLPGVWIVSTVLRHVDVGDATGPAPGDGDDDSEALPASAPLGDVPVSYEPFVLGREGEQGFAGTYRIKSLQEDVESGVTAISVLPEGAEGLVVDLDVLRSSPQWPRFREAVREMVRLAQVAAGDLATDDD